MTRSRATAHRSGDGPPAHRVVIIDVDPEIDGGRHPIKRTVGESVTVEASIFADGHDELSCVLLHRALGQERWDEVRMTLLGNDRWRAAFPITELRDHEYTLCAWIDRYATWLRDLKKRVAAGQDVTVELAIGADLIAAARGRAVAADAGSLAAWETLLRDADPAAPETVLAVAGNEAVLDVLHRHTDRATVARYPRELAVRVDRERARFSAWYEMFPRSCAAEPSRHGTFEDCIARLPYVAEMGFDVLYLPPIHPIGTTYRKGKNNRTECLPDDVGSPWAIGAPQGGHTAIHPALGSVDGFDRLLRAAREYGVEVAIDVAFQCSPDHPWVREHPEWFRKRPDGSIQYAENPPKKYQDIYPLDFETPAAESLWHALHDVFLFWIERGVRIFRVDNPHTKPFAFWQWVITEIRRSHPDVIFLSEAFTRPNVMYELARLGFNQSYTYFAWRNNAWELTEYFTELTQTSVIEYFRPNLWPNTPDILTEYVQTGGRPAFMIRLILAATLGANYGIYGPAFELCEGRPRETGSEEYLDSEKYQLRNWALDSPDSIRDLIARVNRIRRENAALQSDRRLRFHTADNENLLCYSKTTDDFDNAIIVAVNVDPFHCHAGMVDLPGDAVGVVDHEPYQVHDLLTDARYIWHSGRNYVELDPAANPAHILHVVRKVRTERDFEYYR